MEHFLCIMIFFQYAHDSFQVQFHLVYYFYAVVSFLHSCYVNVFHWFSVSSTYNTICLFEHKNKVYIGKIFIAYNPVVKTMADLYLGCL